MAVQDIMETATTEIADVAPGCAGLYRTRRHVHFRRAPRTTFLSRGAAGRVIANADFASLRRVHVTWRSSLKASSHGHFRILADSVKSFEELTYAKLAEVQPQWPIVGGDLYYGGTTYENKKGMGRHLTTATEHGETVDVPRVQKEAAPRPKEKELLAVPVKGFTTTSTTSQISADLLRDRLVIPASRYIPKPQRTLDWKRANWSISASTA